MEVFAAQVPIKLVAQAINHGGIGLQHHANAQAVDEHRSDQIPVSGAAGLFFHNAGQGQQIIWGF